MGLYIKTRRAFMPGLTYTEAARQKAIYALELFTPFTLIGDNLTITYIGVHRNSPIETKHDEEKPIERTTEIAGKNTLGRTVEVLKALLNNAVSKWRTLYNTYVIIEARYEPPGEPGIPLYLMVANGAPSLADIELDVYDWIYDDKVVESLEETLEIVGHPSFKELFMAVGRLHRKLSGHAIHVDRAVIGREPEALEDMTQARAVWLPTEARILSYALDTIEYLKEFDDKMDDLYDYYQPYKKGLIVSMIANSREYRLYLQSRRIANEASITTIASVVVESKNGSLKGLFDVLRQDILEPFAKEVLEVRSSEIKLRASEYIKTELMKRLLK